MVTERVLVVHLLELELALGELLLGHSGNEPVEVLHEKAELVELGGDLHLLVDAAQDSGFLPADLLLRLPSVSGVGLV